MTKYSRQADNTGSHESSLKGSLMPMANILWKIWRGLRALSGEDAYERYLAHWNAHHAQEAKEPLSRRDFFKAELERKWQGVKRCC
jgi:uncharacterized short protein YbdD (DUF466 family)